jgi:uncharacterized protein with ParB-like and HNH nuclease domain
MNLADIPQLTRSHYHTDVSFQEIEHVIGRWSDEGKRSCPLILEPEFQRGHVWTKEQQIAFCEFLIRGGHTGRDIIFNCRGWQRNYEGPMYLVDGLQRLTAIRGMLRGDVPVFGRSFLEFEDHDVIARRESLRFHVGNVSTYADVLKWYLEMNTGGTPHSASEIARVTAMWEAETKKV